MRRGLANLLNAQTSDIVEGWPPRATRTARPTVLKAFAMLDGFARSTEHRLPPKQAPTAPTGNLGEVSVREEGRPKADNHELKRGDVGVASSREKRKQYSTTRCETRRFQFEFRLE
uniref:Uncharacterized protein n=1 Tax=Trichuris muris TaxID=70415 RepID=A0A5S6QIN3_TRIMR